MPGVIKCTLCGAVAEFYSIFREISYYSCSECCSILMDPVSYLSKHEEKARYDKHNNDVSDPGYRQFVKPLVDRIKVENNRNAVGLDYGAGPGPVASFLLQEEGYRMQLYDPFYYPDQAVLETQYDFIICCEVIKHFHFPYDQFVLLKSLLRPGGSLYCMTELHNEEIEFEHWHYKNDPTHVFFYHRKTLEWIREKLCFSDLLVANRLIHFTL
jgi:SAM-dependent methyltransferase